MVWYNGVMIIKDRSIDFRDIIDQLRERGWTLKGIAETLGVSLRSVESWHTGYRYPQYPLLIADHLKWLRGRHHRRQRRLPDPSQVEG